LSWCFRAPREPSENFNIQRSRSDRRAYIWLRQLRFHLNLHGPKVPKNPRSIPCNPKWTSNSSAPSRGNGAARYLESYEAIAESSRRRSIWGGPTLHRGEGTLSHAHRFWRMKTLYLKRRMSHSILEKVFNLSITFPWYSRLPEWVTFLFYFISDTAFTNSLYYYTYHTETSLILQKLHHTITLICLHHHVQTEADHSPLRAKAQSVLIRSYESSNPLSLSIYNHSPSFCLFWSFIQIVTSYFFRNIVPHFQCIDHFIHSLSGLRKSIFQTVIIEITFQGWAGTRFLWRKPARYTL
jgi:hypothetical protein